MQLLNFLMENAWISETISLEPQGSWAPVWGTGVSSNGIILRINVWWTPWKGYHNDLLLWIPRYVWCINFHMHLVVLMPLVFCKLSLKRERERETPYSLVMTSMEWVKAPISTNTVIHVCQIVVLKHVNWVSRGWDSDHSSSYEMANNYPAILSKCTCGEFGFLVIVKHSTWF